MRLSEAQRIAARVAASSSLLDVRVMRLGAELHSIPDSDDYEFQISLEASHSPVSSDGRCVYQLRASVNAIIGGEKVATCSVTVAGLYELASDASQEELRAFGDATAALMLFPYVRSNVQDLASRLGIPNVTLPIYQVALERGDVELPSSAKHQADVEVHE